MSIYKVEGEFGEKVHALAQVEPNDVMNFAKLSGDNNPLHIDPEYASRTQFRGRIAHGFISIVYVFQALNSFVEMETTTLNLVEFNFISPCREGEILNLTLIFSKKEIKVNIVDTEYKVICKGRLLVTRLSKKMPDHYFKLKNDIQTAEFRSDKDLGKKFRLPYDLIEKACCEKDNKLSNLFFHSQRSVLFSLSTIVGMYLPGKQALFRSFELQFMNECFSSNGLNAEAEVERIYNAGSSIEAVIQFSCKETELATARVKSSILKSNRKSISIIDPKSYHQYRYLLENKKALVLGGSRGIGAAVAQLLAFSGSDVLLQFNNGLNDAQRIQKHIKDEGFNCEIIHLDLSDLDKRNTFHQKVKDLCSNKLDILVNSIATSFLPNRIENFSKKDFQAMLNTDLYGLSTVILDLVYLLEKSDRAKIVNLGSLITEKPVSGQLPYGIVKAALEALSKSLAHELKDKNIEVNLVSPALTSTTLTSHINQRLLEKLLEDNGQDTLLEPIDVAKVVLFFCSSLSDKISGQRLFINNKEENYL